MGITQIASFRHPPLSRKGKRGKKVLQTILASPYGNNTFQKRASLTSALALPISHQGEEVLTSAAEENGLKSNLKSNDQPATTGQPRQKVSFSFSRLMTLLSFYQEERVSLKEAIIGTFKQVPTQA